MSDSYQFFIVGGGPGGSVTAALLAGAGYRVALCEQKTFPRAKVCGEFVSAQARPVLKRLGALAEFDRLGGPPICRVRACPQRGRPLTAFMPAAVGAFPRAIARDAFDQLLLDRARAAGATILQPCHVTSVARNDAGFVIETTAHGALAATAVVLAHGLAQKGDLSPGWRPPPRPRGNSFVCFKAHFENLALADNTIAIGGIRGLYAGAVRTTDLPEDGDGRVGRRCYSVAFAVKQEMLARYGSSAEANYGQLAGGNPGFNAVLARAQRVSPWLASGPLDPGVRTLYREGRFFVGNAAGEVHALVGEGMTLALAGGALLADTVVAAHVGNNLSPGALNAIGRAYAARWHAMFGPRYRAANIFTSCLIRPFIADAAAMMLRLFPTLLDACVAHSGKLATVG